MASMIVSGTAPRMFCRPLPRSHGLDRSNPARPRRMHELDSRRSSRTSSPRPAEWPGPISCSGCSKSTRSVVRHAVVECGSCRRSPSPRWRVGSWSGSRHAVAGSTARRTECRARDARRRLVSRAALGRGSRLRLRSVASRKPVTPGGGSIGVRQPIEAGCGDALDLTTKIPRTLPRRRWREPGETLKSSRDEGCALSEGYLSEDYIAVVWKTPLELPIRVEKT